MKEKELTVNNLLDMAVKLHQHIEAYTSSRRALLDFCEKINCNIFNDPDEASVRAQARLGRVLGETVERDGT